MRVQNNIDQTLDLIRVVIKGFPNNFNERVDERDSPVAIEIKKRIAQLRQSDQDTLHAFAYSDEVERALIFSLKLLTPTTELIELLSKRLEFVESNNLSDGWLMAALREEAAHPVVESQTKGARLTGSPLHQATRTSTDDLPMLPPVHSVGFGHDKY